MFEPASLDKEARVPWLKERPRAIISLLSIAAVRMHHRPEAGRFSVGKFSFLMRLWHAYPHR